MEHVKIHLLDKYGEVQYGLNWGQRDGRDKNQAYLQLEPEVYKTDFFPPKGKFFIAKTDDGQTIIFNRAQKEIGTAIQTPENNSLIGVYLRNRMGIPSEAPITKEDIEKYGRNDIDVYKVDDMNYRMDFSNGTHAEKKNHFPTQSLQQIYYGAPGTGKSFEIQRVIKEYGNDKAVRTTFHPDSDYSSFVGTYKPTMSDVRITTFNGTKPLYADSHDKHPGTERKIVYKFVPQAFLKAYVDAWKDLNNPHFLIIEEINRGNCAQIFGDLFQLLDRNSQGCSSYTIHADEDIHQFLKHDDKGFKTLSAEQRKAIEGFVHIEDNGSREEIGSQIADGELLLLPPNLHIWATMNTSDQSLFPIDSAFKRRWNWEYVPIEYDKKNWLFEVSGKRYRWGDFLRAINPIIYELTDSTDKQMGYFFAKPDKKSNPSLEENNIIPEKLFLNKVLFYIWTDVLKDYDVSDEPFIVKDSDPQRTYIFTDFFNKEHNYLEEFITKEKLGLVPVADIVFDDADLSDMNDEKPLNNGINAKVNGKKVWTITYALYNTLDGFAKDKTFDEIESLVKKYIPRDIAIVKTIPSAKDYVKENGWFNYVLTSADEKPFVITNQWKKEFWPNIRKLAEDMGVEFVELNDNSSINDDSNDNNAKNGSRDNSKYSVNGGEPLKKGPTAVEAMKIYIDNNPDASALDIVNAWTTPGFPLVETEETFQERMAKSKEEPKSLESRVQQFILNDGSVIRLFKGFDLKTINNFIEAINAKPWGINIQKMEE